MPIFVVRPTEHRSPPARMGQAVRQGVPGGWTGLVKEAYEKKPDSFVSL